MVQFETQVYRKEGGSIVGAEVIVIGEDGENIGSIVITSKTEYDALVERINNLATEFIAFDEDSSLSGLTIDEILENLNEDATINATKLGGYQSDAYSKTGHTHQKTAITDLYNYDISVDNANPNIGNSGSATITVTAKVTNQSGTPVGGHNVIFYKDNVVWKNGTTNGQGIVTTTFTATDPGIVTFGVNNNVNKIQANVTYDTGWVNCDFALNGVFKVAENQVCQVRRIGNTVHLRGTVESKEDYPLLTWQDYIGTCILPDEKFFPTRNESFVGQASRKQRCAVRINSGGGVVVGRFSDSNSSGAYTIYQGLSVNLGYTYFV